MPRLADGVELLGAYQGSGYRRPASLVRGRTVIRMSALLDRVTCRTDGTRGPARRADLVLPRGSGGTRLAPGPLVLLAACAVVASQPSLVRAKFGSQSAALA